MCTATEGFLLKLETKGTYMFPADIRMTEQLTDRIERWNRKNGGLRFVDPQFWPCQGTVRNAKGEEESCKGTKRTDVRLYPRKGTLYALNHDRFSVVLIDWKCADCSFENRYCGESHTIFPAARHRSFTVELLCFWVHECMNRAISFRSVFEITCHLQDTSSYGQNFETNRLDVLAPEFRRDRRLPNESFRSFCDEIDIGSETACAKTLFSCRQCEVELTPHDCEQLGIRHGHANGLKLFKSLVMDGKVIGALREFPIDTDNVQTIVGGKGLPSKLMSNRMARSAMQNFFKSVRRMVRAIEYHRADEVVNNISYKNGLVHFRLGTMLDQKGVMKGN